MQWLRSYGLADDLALDPRQLQSKAQQIADKEPTTDSLYALAELAYVGGTKLQAKHKTHEALNLYGAAVAQAYLYLVDPRFAGARNAFDPQFRAACEVYNSALEAALRVARDEGTLHPGANKSIQCGDQEWDITITVRDSRWPAEDFGKVEFVSDFEVKGLANHYHTYGLGVPLVVVRKGQSRNDPAEPYYAPGWAYGMTAFLRLEPDSPASGLTPKRHRGVLELYDPTVTSETVVCGQRVPLETDLSTPLAYALDLPCFKDIDQSTLGLLRPDAKEVRKGLYMLEPYQSNKIPVLMIHGLWSSPLTWMEMFNDLRAQPELRANYQFWFFQYPTGQPFWQSATELRQTLAELHNRLDPRHQSPALDQMVLVGHSMGGLVAWLQTVDSGEDFWRLNSDRPLELVKAEAPVKDDLANTFYFRPSMSVRRLITIGTPHLGSGASNDATQWLGRNLISLSKSIALSEKRLQRDNPGYFRPGALIDTTTSIDSLSPRNPILPTMLHSPRAPWISFHNIVGELPKDHRDIWYRLSPGDGGEGDGVVSLASARMDNANSEYIVPAEHADLHRHPLSVLEVRRVLMEEIAELRQNPAGPPRILQASQIPAAIAPRIGAMPAQYYGAPSAPVRQ